ncbi:hypothetical protein CERZMDRAFT_53649 [Cercospora zeae-maydis SCOH1-5]|uniref:AAA+ ATPase domain-containing protein n=1 Tax=Cercospora zeae-maydis SCOH1-5 TaxID=717836 RepID=A0A6A6EXT9_9PEZI|nr:hypothetical protein CERZMDRAFT_53649 [Cercospora zeae-maydis SCOH1-5]
MSKDDSPGQSSLYEAFKARFTCPHEYGELLAHDAVRALYPGKHITAVSDNDAKLFAYANAGHATASLVQDASDFLALRDYTAPALRLEGGDGKLSDKIRFGLYKYEHHGVILDVVRAQWYIDYAYSRREKIHFILSPRESIDEQSHCAQVDALITAAGRWTAQLHDEVYVFDQSYWAKDKSLWAAVQASSWDDVILDPAMKANIIKDVEGFFDSRSIYEQYNVPWKRGLILHGTPGCGKTISIKALMNSLQGRDVVSLYVKTLKNCQGEEYSIRTIFEKARKMAPCMLIFEDLDSLVNDRIRSYFLNEVDGMERNDGILMIGSTNHLARLDPGISKRPSRFDRKYHYKLPAENERMAYCNYWRNKLEKTSDIEFHDDIAAIFAQLTDGFSFAYLKELFVQTLLTIVGGRADADDEDDTHSDGAELSGQGKDPAKEHKKPSRQLAEVSIPDHLQDNTLMRILQKQVKVLWREMDNTSGDEKVGKQESSDEDEDEDADGCCSGHRAVKSGQAT